MNGDLLTLEELTDRVGMSVRNVRFYTTRGLVPPPIRHGRSGYYSADHVARLEMVQDLQQHGFTLAAIERYMAGIPESATPEDVALARTLLSPWQARNPVRMTRAELARRAGRDLSDGDVETLIALGVVTTAGRSYDVEVSMLSMGLGFVDLGYPIEAVRATAAVYAEHGRAIAEEAYDIFRKQVWPHYRDSGTSPEKVQEAIERFKPLSIAGLVAAYEAGVDQMRRDNISKRTRPPAASSRTVSDQAEGKTRAKN